MEKKVLNYRVIVEPYKEKGKKLVYIAECPTLGVYDWGDSIEQVLKSIKRGISIHINNLIKTNEEVPVDNIQEEILITTQIEVPVKDLRLALN